MAKRQSIHEEKFAILAKSINGAIAQQLCNFININCVLQDLSFHLYSKIKNNFVKFVQSTEAAFKLFRPKKDKHNTNVQNNENWDIPFDGFRVSFLLAAGYCPKNIVSWNEYSFEVFTVCNMDILGRPYSLEYPEVGLLLHDSNVDFQAH